MANVAASVAREARITFFIMFDYGVIVGRSESVAGANEEGDQNRVRRLLAQEIRGYPK
jgi:hypothetical protein